MPDWTATAAALTGAASTLRNGLRVVRLDNPGEPVGLHLRFDRSVDSIRASAPCVIAFDPVRTSATVPRLFLSFESASEEAGAERSGESIVQYTAWGFRICDRIVPWYVAVLAFDPATGCLHGLEPGQVQVDRWGRGIGRSLKARRALAIVPVARLARAEQAALRLIQAPTFDPAIVFTSCPAGSEDRAVPSWAHRRANGACRRIN